jgi:hypothetical protein
MAHLDRSGSGRFAWPGVYGTVEQAFREEEPEVTPEAIGVLIGTGIAFMALVGSVLALVFNVGSLKGQITTFMQVSERDRADILKDIGRIEERLERHTEGHDRGK